MNEDDREYYVGRMAAEQRAARLATHPVAARTHERLAEEYESLIIATAGISARGAPEA